MFCIKKALQILSHLSKNSAISWKDIAGRTYNLKLCQCYLADTKHNTKYGCEEENVLKSYLIFYLILVQNSYWKCTFWKYWWIKTHQSYIGLRFVFGSTSLLFLFTGDMHTYLTLQQNWNRFAVVYYNIKNPHDKAAHLLTKHTGKCSYCCKDPNHSSAGWLLTAARPHGWAHKKHPNLSWSVGMQLFSNSKDWRFITIPCLFFKQRVKWYRDLQMHLLAMAANYHSGSGSYPSCSRIITPNESGGAGFLALLSCLRVTDSQRQLHLATEEHYWSTCHGITFRLRNSVVKKHMMHSKAEENITPQDQTVPLCQDCLKCSLSTGQHSSLTQSHLRWQTSNAFVYRAVRTDEGANRQSKLRCGWSKPWSLWPLRLFTVILYKTLLTMVKTCFYQQGLFLL